VASVFWNEDDDNEEGLGMKWIELANRLDATRQNSSVASAEISIVA